MTSAGVDSKEGVCVLGATGSIGQNTLDVVARHPGRYNLHSVSAHTDWKQLLEICRHHKPKYAVLSDERLASEAESAFKASNLTTTLLTGSNALNFIAEHEESPIVMAAIVGAAGLNSALAAAKAGKKILLANKESLVLSGRLFMQAVAESGARLLPIDSEHNAIFQCLPEGYSCGQTPGTSVSKLLLTASGGPFRGFSKQRLSVVTPNEACAHPNWSMGKKISVDSASLMNKGLELIEACWLFSLQPSDIDVVVHPQSIVHSMVRYKDGSVLAQMGQPDMRTPIAYGLAWPERIDAGVKELDFYDMASLDFARPDNEAFPCLELARTAFVEGGFAPAYLNAANEVAVEAFLKGNIRFTAIPDIIARCIADAPSRELETIAQVLDADSEARQIAKASLPRFYKTNC